MVLQFAPWSNDSDPCGGILAYNAQRPPKQQSLRDANLACFLIVILIYLISFVPLWLWRKKSRFNKVRPLLLNVVFAIGMFATHVACNLAYTYELPCAFMLICFVLPIAWLNGIALLRSYALVFEAAYANLVKRRSHVIQDDRESSSYAMSASHGPSLSIVRSLIYDSILMVGIIVGALKVENLTMSDLLIAKSSYGLSMVLVSVPAVVAIIVVISVVPPFQTCVDCEVFLEIPISVLSVVLAYVLTNIRAAILAFRAVGWDDKGVVVELMNIPTVIGLQFNALWIVVTIDPGNLSFNREFNFTILFAVTTMVVWFNGVGYQLYVQWTMQKKASAIEIPPMKAMMGDPEISAKFTDFAAEHYVSESLNFLQDVTAFKKFFYEKGDSWKLAKFKSLVETYVLIGSQMEVNISHGMRGKIISLYNSPQGHQAEFFDAFDEAHKDVEDMIQNGPWTEFIMRRLRHRSEVGAVVPAVN